MSLLLPWLWAAAKKLPAIVWVIALVLSIIAAWGAAMYHTGHTNGVREVKRAALAVETPKAIARVDTAHAHSATVLTVATKARAVSDTTRAQREAIRSAALAQLCGDPALPAVTKALAFDDTLSQRDSVTIAVQAGAIDTLSAEIAARERLDSLRVETIQIGSPEPDHHTTAKVVGGIVVGILGTLTLFHFAR